MNGIEGTQIITRQIIALLRLLDGDVFSRPLNILDGGTLGQHFRHILDFYLCLLRDLPTGTIDYAARERNPALEKDPERARELFDQVAEAVKQVEEREALLVRADFSSRPMDDRPEISSSAGRELMFAYDHAVHHLAIIRIGLRAAFPSLPLQEHLGVAPSTLKYRADHQTKDLS